MIKRDALYASNSDEWSTPQDIYDALDDEFHFTLDPCATDENHKCDLYYTQSSNGLLQNWGGKESSVIHHIAKLALGLKRHIAKQSRTIQSSCCLFHPERIQNIFTTLSISEQRSGLFVVV